MNKTAGTGLGKGHGGNSNLPAIREVLPENMDASQKLTLSLLQPGSRIYRMGKCKIFVSPPLDEKNGWHMSISREDRLPTWDETAKAWYELVPDAVIRTGAAILPPVTEYINIHNFCMQIHELLP